MINRWSAKFIILRKIGFLLLFFLLLSFESSAISLTIPRTDFPIITVGGGYDVGGITLKNGTGYFKNNINVDGNLTVNNITSSNITQTKELQDQDASNFFDNTGSASQTLTSIDNTGALTFASISILESQISNLQSYLLSSSSFFNSFWNGLNLSSWLGFSSERDANSSIITKNNRTFVLEMLDNSTINRSISLVNYQTGNEIANCSVLNSCSTLIYNNNGSFVNSNEKNPSNATIEVGNIGGYSALMRLENVSNKLTNNSDAIFDEVNTTNNVFIQGLLNATRLNGSLSCNQILFDNGQGSTAICDGADSTGVADPSVYNAGNATSDISNSTIQRQAPAFNTANNLSGNSFFASFFNLATNWTSGFGTGGNNSWQRETTAFNAINWSGLFNTYSTALFTKANWSDSFGSGGNQSWQRETTSFNLANNFTAQVPLCSGTNKITSTDGNTLSCATDQTGGGGGGGDGGVNETFELSASVFLSRTMINIGTTYTSVYTTAFDPEDSYINTTGKKDVKIRFMWDYIGVGTQNVQWINGANVLLVSANILADCDPCDTGWVDLPTAFENFQGVVTWQGKSTTGTDDPVAKGYFIYLR